MSEPENKPEKAEKPKGGGPLPLLALVIGVLNLGATGFVGFTLMHMPAAGAAQEEAAPEEEAAPGQLAAMDTFVVNLDESGAPRYLKASMSVELTNAPDAVSKFDVEKHKLRDGFIRYLSSLRVDDTRGEAGKDKIRHELLARAQEDLGKERVKDIYFGEFVVQ